MKKVLSVISCSILAACSCSDNQWEEVDVATFEEPIYEEEIVVEPAPAPVTEQTTVYTVDPQPSCSCACQAVQVQPCYMPCPCMQPVVMPAPQPKITTTKKIITTTTTVEEPCGKPVCEPVVTTHEEIIPAEVSYQGYTESQPVVVSTPQPREDFVEVTVEKNPYRSEIVDMQSSSSKLPAKTAAKYSPEAYNVVATRATNRMLQDTSSIYDNGRTKTVFIKDTKLLSSDLPYGSQRLKGTTKDIISGSKTFDVVNNSKDADYIIASSADWYVSNIAAPALQYKLSMFDRSGKKINEWVEIIRQVQE